MFYPTLKVVSSNCNLRCIYCYYDGIHKSKYTVMDDLTLKSVIQKLLTLEQDKSKVHFYWHGGEPLMAGIKFYKKILKLEKELNVKEKKIVNHIQTNATLLSKKWVNFFIENNFNIGVSIDGPEDIHNINRPSISKNGSFDSVMSGIKLLQKNGRYPNAISVITKHSLGKAKEIFDFFKEIKVKKFLPKDCCDKDNSGRFLPFATTPDEYVDFLIELFECWMQENDPSIEIRNLYQIIKGVIGGKPSLCEYSGKCQLFLTIEHDGTVGGCDSFPIKNYPMGNIKYSSIEDVVNSNGYKNFVKDMSSSRVKCRQCEWFGNICNGGCVKHSYSTNSTQRSSWTKDMFCDSKKRLFSYIQKRVREIQSMKITAG